MRNRILNCNSVRLVIYTLQSMESGLHMDSSLHRRIIPGTEMSLSTRIFNSDPSTWLR